MTDASGFARIVHDPAGGPPGALRLEPGPMPQPGPGEVLIAVEAAGVNRPDLLQRQGAYPPPPGAHPGLGLEVAGRVMSLGPPLPDVAPVVPLEPGMAVCALANGGGYATHCVVPAGQCLPWPAGFDAVRAAALPENLFTVWGNAVRIGRLAAGETFLVHGGSSGIGLTAIQIGRALGARVIATAGTAAKGELAREYGAQHTINYRQEDFADRVAALTDGHGVDVVLDMVGAAYLDRNLRCLAPDGRLVIIGLQGGASADAVDLARIMTRRLVVTGSTLRPRPAAFKAVLARDLFERVWPMLERSTVRPVVNAVMKLSEAGEAHALLESGEHSGKIVLTVGEGTVD